MWFQEFDFEGGAFFVVFVVALKLRNCIATVRTMRRRPESAIFSRYRHVLDLIHPTLWGIQINLTFQLWVFLLPLLLPPKDRRGKPPPPAASAAPEAAPAPEVAEAAEPEKSSRLAQWRKQENIPVFLVRCLLQKVLVKKKCREKDFTKKGFSMFLLLKKWLEDLRGFQVCSVDLQVTRIHHPKWLPSPCPW